MSLDPGLARNRGLREAQFLEVVTTINEVLGMGIELATVLGVMGTVWTGNPLSLNPGFSIGGPNSETDNLLDNLGGLLGASSPPIKDRGI